MSSAHDRFRLSAAILLGMTFSMAGNADTEVHKQGNSTAVVTQGGGSGASSTQVIRTPDSQKIITRDGKSTDVTIQRSTSSSKGSKAGSKADADDMPKLDKSRFERDSLDCAKSKCPPTRSTNLDDADFEDDIPSAEEFKDRMRSRMRPVFPKP